MMACCSGESKGMGGNALDPLRATDDDPPGTS